MQQRMLDCPIGLSPELIAEAVAWRHDLHRDPELAFNEKRTSDFVAAKLGRFGLKVHRGLGGTGVVGTLTRGTSSRAIGIRADMDALSIEEQSGVAHASVNEGLMHACGHDGHTAIALAAAQVCAQLRDLNGTVHFIFQPAEEGEGGAKRMIDDGLFRMFPCERVYALHNQPVLPFGQCVARDGVMMAASGVFEITIAGRGCHGGRPHQGTDSLLAGCQLVSSLQSIVSRNADPLAAAVVSVTQFHSGHAWSVIPEKSVLRGTTRWFDDSIGDLIERHMRRLSEAIAAGFGCTAEVHYDRRYPATVNDAAAASFVRRIAATVRNLNVADQLPSTGSEDFSEMLRVVPGCYLWLGAGRTDKDPGLHSSLYDFNDELLPLGVVLWVALVRESLRLG